jgi:hypothetical protein
MKRAETIRNLHVPLPEEMYLALRAEAEHSQRPANALAREAIAQWLELQRQARLDQAVREYAEAMAGTLADLDPDLEAAGLELLGREA